MVDIDAAVEMVLAERRRVPAQESMLVAVSGIDGSGKGYVAGQIITRLQQKRYQRGDGECRWLAQPSTEALS